jgi:hypothetical protein
VADHGQSGRRNAGKISACRNFEVEDERPIFYMRMLSDGA